MFRVMAGMRGVRRWMFVLALASIHGAAHAACSALPSQAPGFGEGAAEPLSERVYQAQDLEYARVVAEFDHWLERNPSDSVAAVERCRFIDLFASSEEHEIEQASEAAQVCRESLSSGPLSASTAARIFLWESTWGDDAIRQGEAMLADHAPWDRRQLRQIHETLAQQYASEDVVKAGEHALIAVNLDANSSSRLQAAEHLVRIGARARGVAMLKDMPVANWNQWNLTAAVRTLLDVGEPREAAALIRLRTDLIIGAAERARLARALVEVGEPLQAQALMDTLVNEPDTPGAGAIAKELFAFRLAHGSQAEAVAAYRKLRDAGYVADPFARARLRLLLEYPAAPWSAADLLGVAALGGCLIFFALLPLVVVAPLHYWSLFRRVRGRGRAGDVASWNLGHLWYVLAVVCVAAFAVTYLFSYDAFESLVFQHPLRTRSIADDRDLGRALLCMEVLALIGLLPLMMRAGARRHLVGDWPFGKSLAAGVGTSFALLMGAGILNAINRPGLALGGDTIRAMQGLYALYGSLGLLVTASLLTPIVEEFVFRGVFLQVAARDSYFWVAAILQSCIFIALHDQAGAYLFLFALAMAASWLAWRSKGLAAPIMLHVTNNVMASLAIMGVTRAVAAVP